MDDGWGEVTGRVVGTVRSFACIAVPRPKANQPQFISTSLAMWQEIAVSEKFANPRETEIRWINSASYIGSNTAYPRHNDAAPAIIKRPLHPRAFCDIRHANISKEIPITIMKTGLAAAIVPIVRTGRDTM